MDGSFICTDSAAHSAELSINFLRNKKCIRSSEVLLHGGQPQCYLSVHGSSLNALLGCSYQVLPALCTPNSCATVRALTEPPCSPCLEAFWRGSREALSCKSCSGNPQSHIHCVPNVSHNFLPCFSITVSVCHGVFAQAFCKPCDFGDRLTLPSSRRA